MADTGGNQRIRAKGGRSGMSKSSTDVVLEHLEGRLSNAPRHADNVAAELDQARCLASERKGAITVLESRANVRQSRIGDLERKLTHAEQLLGELTPEHVGKVAEVLELGVHLRDRWEKWGAKPATFDALDGFCKAVNEMEGES